MRPARLLRPGAGHGLLLGLLLAAALAVRLAGLYWDSGYLFHPDERKILTVAAELCFPWRSPGLFLSVDSPWNPRFFSYGSLPIYLVRIASGAVGVLWPPARGLAGSAAVGRALSALADVGSVALVYLLGRRLRGRGVGLLAAAFLALAPLHIQVSHYYAVDTLLTCLALLALYLALDLRDHPSAARGRMVGLAWGAAIATKLTALPLAAPIGVAWYLGLRRRAPQDGRAGVRWALREAAGGLALTATMAAAAFVLLEPYALIDVARFLRDVVFEARMAGGAVDVPYTRQYIGTVPFLYPLAQMVVWSLGLPLGIAGCAGAVAALGGSVADLTGRRALRRGEAVVLVWLVTYLATTATLHAKFARYMLPAVPLLCLWAAWGLVALRRWLGRFGQRAAAAAGWLTVGVFAATAFLGVGYLHVYSQPHTWLRATRWICANVPAGSRILVEHWDDPLPIVSTREGLSCHSSYEVTSLPLYDEDTPRKAAALAEQLAGADYVIVSSSRLYGAIAPLTERYPYTARYYRLLFGEHLAYRLVHYEATYARFLGIDLVNDTLGPAGLPVPRLLRAGESLRRALWLGRADESLFVYDHPMPLVFRQTGGLSATQIEALLTAPSSAPN